MTNLTFNGVEETPLDLIMKLDQAFRDDSDPQKVNLVVGVYQDDEGQSPVLDCVKAAESRLLDTEQTKVYVPMSGEKAFLTAAENLVFGSTDALIKQQRIASLHTPGGTAALRLAGDFIAEHFPDRTVWISDPAYPNHQGIMQSLGLNCEKYRYFDFEQGVVRFNYMLEDLSAANSGDIIILHGCCHNPSGADLTPEQWKKLAAVLKTGGLIPVIDLAYLGYADGINSDADSIRIVFEQCPEGVVTISFSKNFALYAERTGLITFVGENNESAIRCAAKTRSYVRRLYTSPPVHGGRIITTILKDPQLREQWVGEVSSMRDRLKEMRVLLFDALQSRHVDMDYFPGLTRLKGMFVLTQLSESHVSRLRDEYHIYMLPNGRISIAAVRPATINYLADAFALVLSS